MKHAVNLPNMAEPAALVDLAVTAERAGWDGVFLWDHVAYAEDVGLPLVDPWVVLGAIAQATTRVRLGTMVTPIARRRPWRVAQEVTTLDHLSGGRAVLGVGLGWPDREDFANFGEPDDHVERAAMLDEGLEVIDALWSGAHVDHLGDHFDVVVSAHWEESPAAYAEAGATWLIQSWNAEPDWLDQLGPLVEQGPPPV